MTQKFAKLARAYEVLSDERRRQDYDYALKYPEDKERNRAMFYRDKYSNQQGLKARFTHIFLGIAIVVTLFQFFNDRSVYRNVWLDFKDARHIREGDEDEVEESERKEDDGERWWCRE